MSGPSNQDPTSAGASRGRIRTADSNYDRPIQPLKVRWGTQKDLPELQALATATSRHLRIDDEIAAAQTDRQRCLLVAELGGQACGFVAARAVVDEAEILAIATLPGARRRGVARRLLVALEEELRALGVRRLMLEVSERNGPARACYQATGFAQTGRRPGYYPDGSAALLMAREIGNGCA